MTPPDGIRCPGCGEDRLIRTWNEAPHDLRRQAYCAVCGRTWMVAPDEEGAAGKDTSDSLCNPA